MLNVLLAKGTCDALAGACPVSSRLNRSTTPVLIALILASNPCFATIYKWHTAEGQVTYSQLPPPPGTPVEIVSPAGFVDSEQALKNLKRMEHQVQRYERTREDNQRRATDLAQRQKVQQFNCALARDKLGRLSTIPRVYTVSKDGTRRKIGEDERQAKIREAKALASKYCQ